MSAVWKTPRGSDAMPEIMVKIIGSKHFRYLVEKPKINENENFITETQTMHQEPMTDNARQMSRDPPAPVNFTDQQTNDNPDDVKENKHTENNQKSENNQKLLTGVHNSRFLDVKDIGQRPRGTTNEDTFLLALVRRELKSRPLRSNLLEKLQTELKILDPISSGFLLQSQLSHLFLRHELPLQLPTVKILCQRFSKRGSPEMVNYEKLLWFLNSAASDYSQQNKAVADQRKTESHGNHSQSTPPQHSSTQPEVNRGLLEILKMALRTTNGKLNIDNLNLSFRKEDRSFSGCLPPPKVRAICGKHGLYLPLSLLETLLSHQDLGYQNEIKWQNFVEILSRASADLLSDLPTGKNEKKASAPPVEPEVPELSQSKTEHMKTPEEELQPENSPAETSASKDPLNSLKIRPVSQSLVNPAMKNEVEECETWIDRFRKLENALYLCDLSNTGVLEKERARRLIHNYNLIYNLSLSPRKIDQALRRFRLGENMLLEPALRYLKEL
uniref:Chromosome 1 open reading frame 87 n=1 Tax=Callithrix jacchus TaxID=9483 RepID=A0A8I4A4C3_CALJA